MTRRRLSTVRSNSLKLSIESLELRQLLTVSSFSLQDVNATSDTFAHMVSPEDFAGQASAWYFGHST